MQYLNKAITLDATQAWSTVWILHLTSDLPFLYNIAHESGQKWDNLTFRNDWQDVGKGVLKEGCILDLHYAGIQDCPKLTKVEQLDDNEIMKSNPPLKALRQTKQINWEPLKHRPGMPSEDRISLRH